MASITVDFSNVTLSSSNTSILLTGGTYGLSRTERLGIMGTATFSSVYVKSNAISLNFTSGTTFNASVSANVTSDVSGIAPTIEVTNFNGFVSVAWPTQAGPEVQTLESGNPLTLSGYVG